MHIPVAQEERMTGPPKERSELHNRDESGEIGYFIPKIMISNHSTEIEQLCPLHSVTGVKPCIIIMEETKGSFRMKSTSLENFKQVHDSIKPPVWSPASLALSLRSLRSPSPNCQTHQPAKLHSKEFGNSATDKTY